MSPRWWKATAAAAAVAAAASLWYGDEALAWAGPLLGAVFAMGLAGKTRRAAAGVLGGAVTGATLAAAAGIGGTIVGDVLAAGAGVGGAVVGGVIGVSAAWAATVGSCMLRTYPLPEPPTQVGPERPVDPGRRDRVPNAGSRGTSPR